MSRVIRLNSSDRQQIIVSDDLINRPVTLVRNININSDTIVSI